MGISLSLFGQSSINDLKSETTLCLCDNMDTDRLLQIAVQSIKDSISNVREIRNVSFKNVYVRYEPKDNNLIFNISSFQNLFLEDFGEDTLIVREIDGVSLFFKSENEILKCEYEYRHCQALSDKTNKLVNPSMRVKRLFHRPDFVYIGFQFQVLDRNKWIEPSFSYLLE